ncbi:unnamed protein product [Parnassius mnemosyne]|uniref:Chromodomain Y-like protein 2 n=1 Tax=Parnassius mnemosyne TaxID=213953 RepID=A0AAV1KW90_9NEOP
MEVIEETLELNASIDQVKNNVVTEETAECIVTDVCHKSNGEAEPAGEENVLTEIVITKESVELLEENNEVTVVTNEVETSQQIAAVQGSVTVALNENSPSQSDHNIEKGTDQTNEPDTEIIVKDFDKTIYHEIEIQATESIIEVSTEPSSVEVNNEETSSFQLSNEILAVQVNHTDSSNKDKVRFKTEILIEKNDHDINENDLNETNSDEHATNNILSELGQSIELSEALRSSDVTDHVESNNCAGRQEVFNKEELLDILQGKDVESSANEAVEHMEINAINSKSLESQLALQQLTRLKTIKKKKSTEKTSKPKKVEKKEESKKDESRKEESKKEESKSDSIINVLVKDWDDEETSETDKSAKLLKEADSLLKSSDELKEVQIAVTAKEEFIRTSIDSATSEDHSQKSKSGDEGQPQRRLGRIIKKKVIFDPDNPDTFTKSKAVSKNKEINTEKESPPHKKGKTDLPIVRSKSKSPISKLQWKKPSLKNVKQNKRLSEVDRLLMDEGAVNMIYQLTPEAPKGKKNVRTKAEFIKKIQSSTPDGKEMKFRERKKESSKYEEGEAKKILSGKHRVSLSSSVKSPSVCEDFETHSADDSIIYRRHSSSSYSSTCMSPRRLSDVDSGVTQNTARTSLIVEKGNKASDGNNKQTSDTFMSDPINITNSEIINRENCLSIKEKLNSKLSLALNKRKRENSKNDKPPKQKKVKESFTSKKDIDVNFKYLTINIDQRLAEITIQKGPKYNIEVLKELEQALIYVDERKDISVTLITSQCGTLCSLLDLSPLLDDDEKKRATNAFEIADSVRSLLGAVEQHSKLVCAGVWGACSGVALALVARSDVALAADGATFALAAHPRRAALQPGLAAITPPSTTLPRSLINDLVVFGRRITASEAQQGGLLSRCLWPDRFPEQLRAIVKDIAAQPQPNILLKKQLLGIRKSGESLSTFLSCLETERDLLVDYWTSVEGQELLRADQDPV